MTYSAKNGSIKQNPIFCRRPKWSFCWWKIEGGSLSLGGVSNCLLSWAENAVSENESAQGRIRNEAEMRIIIITSPERRLVGFLTRQCRQKGIESFSHARPEGKKADRRAAAAAIHSSVCVWLLHAHTHTHTLPGYYIYTYECYYITSGGSRNNLFVCTSL